jgi:hypothetical protein
MNEEAQVRAGLAELHSRHALIELRAVFPDDRWWNGLYDDREALIRSVLGMNGIEAKAIYWTINNISPALASRVTNRMAPAVQGGCIANRDINNIDNLFLDYDSKGSRAAVQHLASNVESYLNTLGWPAPLYMDSGTGCYHFYRVDLPASESQSIKTTIKNLAARFNTDAAIIDTKCGNPARISRVPGTYNRKSQPRMARILTGVTA